GQIALFEDVLGYPLFNRVGRRMALNDAGRVVVGYVDEIFTIGEELQEILRSRPDGLPMQFRVGVADAVPKAIAYLLLEPSMELPDSLRIVCREGKLNDLLADLAIHRLDIVIADSPMPANIDVRGYNHRLGECSVSFFAAEALAQKYSKNFPTSLDGAPFLMAGEDAAVRPRLLRWFEKERVHP